VAPNLILGEEEKFTAFRLADAALATSGTVTLELALAGTPMVVGYRVELLVAMFSWLLRAHSVVLPNLILGENVFPEFIQGESTPDALSEALLPLLDKQSPERQRQIKALKGLEKRMRLTKGTPSQKAAGIVLRQAQRHLIN
jgi:lipid-A-disaccharide synthase